MLNNDDWLLLSIFLFLTALVWTVWYAVRKRSQLLDPIYIFLFFYCLYILPLCWQVYIAKDLAVIAIEHLPQILPFIPWAVFLCAVGLPFFVAGYYSKFATKVARRLLVPAPGGRHHLRAFLLLSAVSIFLIAQLARSSGGLLGFVLLGYDVTAEMVGKGYLAVGFSWLFVGSLFLLYSYATHRRKSYLVSFAIAFAFVLALHLLMWRRNEIVFMIFAVLLFWHHAVRPVRFRVMAITGTALFVILSVAGDIRTSNYESVSDFWSKSLSQFDRRSYHSSGFTSWLTKGDYYAPFETFPQMIKSVGTDVTPQLGTSYLRAPLFWIPSRIYPRRPLALSQWYMQQFYGYGFGLNEGKSFFFLSEGYLNFGPIGPLLTMFFWGVLCGSLQEYRSTAGRNPGAVLLYSLTVAFFLQMIRGESIALLVGLPAQWLAPAALGLLVCERMPRLGSAHGRD